MEFKLEKSVLWEMKFFIMKFYLWMDVFWEVMKYDLGEV